MIAPSHWEYNQLYILNPKVHKIWWQKFTFCWKKESIWAEYWTEQRNKRRISSSTTWQIDKGSNKIHML